MQDYPVLPEQRVAWRQPRTCPWKALASYFTLRVIGSENRDAVWYYPKPKAGADRVAFWKGVQVPA